MRFSPLNYRSLFILYGLSALVLIPFGAVYAFATIHGWNRNLALIICLISGASVALLLWSRLEPRLLAAQSDHIVGPVSPQLFNALPSAGKAGSTWGVASSGQAATAGHVHYAL